MIIFWIFLGTVFFGLSALFIGKFIAVGKNLSPKEEADEDDEQAEFLRKRRQS